MRKRLGVRARSVVPALLAASAVHLAAGLWAEGERGGVATAPAASAAAIPILLAPGLPGAAHRPERPLRRKGPARRSQAPPAAAAPLAVADAGALAPPPPPPATLASPPAEEPGKASAPDAAPPTLTPPALVQSVPYPVSPGYWQVGERWLLFGKTEFYCVDGFDILRFMAQPCNHIYRCAYDRQSVDDGRIRFAGVVLGRNERYAVSGAGDYSATRISVSLTGAGHYKILPVAFSAAIDARFLSSSCPADAKRIRQR